MPRFTIEGDNLETLLNGLRNAIVEDAMHRAMDSVAASFGLAVEAEPDGDDGDGGVEDPSSDADETLTMAQAQRRYGVSYALLKRLGDNGVIALRKQGRNVVLSRTQVEAALQADDMVETVRREQTRARRNKRGPEVRLSALAQKATRGRRAKPTAVRRAA